DPAVSASELALFDAVPDAWPPKFNAATGHRPMKPGEMETVVFGALAALALLVHRSTWPAWLRVFVVLVPLAAFAVAFQRIAATWPPSQPIIDAVRAVAAGV